jgi:hypothetical protein
MNTQQRKLIAAMSLCTGILVAISGAAQASLIDRGGGLIYDTDLNITWLADANYAGTTMTWANAMTWAANLSYYDSVRNVTYDDWRLPTTLQPDPNCGSQSSGDSYGYNCTGSELGHLFYSELGGVAGQYIVTTHDADYNLFTNVQSNVYWSATEYAPDTSIAWNFNTTNGYQLAYYKTYSFYAWAVRPGDVAAAASTVPVPAAAWLFGSGLLGLIGVARRKAA